MKKIITLIAVFILINKTGFGQKDTISFPSIVNGKLTCPVIKKSLLNLPLVFEFDLSYANKTISFYSDKEYKHQIIPNGTFGKAIGKDLNNPKNYFVTIDASGGVTYTPDGTAGISIDTFYIKIGTIGNCGPLIISSKPLVNTSQPPAPASGKNTYTPGYLFYDASELKSFINKTDLSSINKTKAILKYYGISDNASLASNDFLNEFFKDVSLKDSLMAEVEGGTEASSKGLNSIGGIDVTNIVNGVADLMIERAKEELTITFFDRFKKFAENNPEFQILFPKTTDNLNNLLSYTYPQMLPILKTGFFEDLKQLTYHLPQVLELQRYQQLYAKFPEVKVAIRSLTLVHDLEDSTSNAAGIIDSFASFPEWKDTSGAAVFKDAGSLVKLSAIISNSLRDKSDSSESSIWVSGKKIKGLVTDSVLAKIYMGLVYQQIKDSGLTFNGKDIADSFFAKQKSNILFFQSQIQEFISLTDKVSATFASIKVKAKKDITNDDYYNYINVSLDAVDYAFSLVKNFNEDFKGNNYLDIIGKANDLYKAVYSQQYTQAISDGIDIFQDVHDVVNSDMDVNKNTLSSMITYIKNMDIQDSNISAYKDSLNKKLSSIKKINIFQDINDQDILNKMITSITTNINKDNLRKMLTSISNNINRDTLSKMLTFIQKVKPYALLVANIAEAKSSDDVKAALENAILPAGSSSIKKNSIFNISIQSYLGAYCTWYNSSSSVNAWSDKFGVTAPIGISFNWGFNKGPNRNGGSLSTFLSFFDLGAIVDYKLTKVPAVSNTNTTDSVISKDYSVKLGQIFSPGLYFVYGLFGNVPLSIGIGAQYGPGLAKINTTDVGASTEVVNPSIRCNVFLAVDLPFFTLKNRTRYNK